MCPQFSAGKNIHSLYHIAGCLIGVSLQVFLIATNRCVDPFFQFDPKFHVRLYVCSVDSYNTDIWWLKRDVVYALKINASYDSVRSLLAS